MELCDSRESGVLCFAISLLLCAKVVSRHNCEREHKAKKWVHGPGHAREKQETVSDAGMQTLAHNLSKPFRKIELCDSRESGV